MLIHIIYTSTLYLTPYLQNPYLDSRNDCLIWDQIVNHLENETAVGQTSAVVVNHHNLNYGLYDLLLRGFRNQKNYPIQFVPPWVIGKRQLWYDLLVLATVCPI